MQTGVKGKKQVKRKLYTIKFILSPDRKTYGRSVSVNPEMRVFDIIRKMMPSLAKRYPDLFSKITPKQIKNWNFYFGSIEEKNYMELLDPRLSLNDQGVFPGGTIAVGPRSNFTE